MSLFSFFKRSKPVFRQSFAHSRVQELVEQSVGFKPPMADYSFISVTLNEVDKASHDSWMPWKPEKWDCDNQAIAALVELMKQGYKDTSRPFQPAAGLIRAKHKGEDHAFLWFIDAGANVRFYDTTAQFEMYPDEFFNPRAFLI